MYEVLGTSPLTGSGPPFPPLYTALVGLNPGGDWAFVVCFSECF